MILVEEDDGCIHLYPSVDAVALHVEALDAEDCLREVFDERGQRYAIDWIKPNERTRFGSTNGTYRLVPSGNPDLGALLGILERTRGRTPGEGEQAYIQGLIATLQARG